MKLYLVRHGEAKRETEDTNPPLSENGLADVRKIGAYLAEAEFVELDCIMHSGKERAKQTAEILSHYLSPHLSIKESRGLMPLDDPRVWAKRLIEIPENTMLVGHLPFIGKLASLLLCNDEIHHPAIFDTATIACLEHNEGIWSLAWLLPADLLFE